MEAQFKALGRSRRKRTRDWARELYKMHACFDTGEPPTNDQIKGYVKQRVGFIETIIIMVIVQLIVKLIIYWITKSVSEPAPEFQVGEPGYDV